jgi:hypothetical protein
LADVWAGLEATPVAQAIGGSVLLTGLLSAVHALGMTLVTGAVIVAALRPLGLAFPDAPSSEVTRAARAGIVAGLAVSLSTGLLLFSTRATAAVENDFFQLKMAILALAILFHFGLYRRMLAAPGGPGPGGAAAAVLSIVLWLGVAGAGAAYILLE